jgi:short-subunit dehydrogenase
MSKVAIITGASSGIGKESAILLAQNNFKVYALARRLDKMEDLKKYGILPLQMDITDFDSINSALQKIFESTQKIDILLNNAGYGSYGSLEDVPIVEAKKQFEVNLFGLAAITKLVLPFMRNQKNGRIINVSSIGGKIGEPHGAWYHSSKFAVEGLSDCLRMELKQFGIKVILIEPGPIFTEWNSLARQSLIQNSGQTAYQNLAQKHYKMLEMADKNGSTAREVANITLRAAIASNPKSRYVVGRGAKLILFLRQIFGDKVFDWLMLKIIHRF